MTSTVSDSVDWYIKDQELWDTVVYVTCNLFFSCFKSIDDYNFSLGDVDISEQLEFVYWPEIFLCNKNGERFFICGCLGL